MSLQVQVIQYPDFLDGSKVTQFHREIENIIEAGVKIVLLDLNNVTTMSSSGLMALVSVLRVIRSAGCTLRVHSISEQVGMLFEITGLDQVFEISHTL